MIDDAVVRLQVLKNVPDLDPWRLEMEEIDFGDSLGCSVLIGSVRHRFKAQSWSKKEGRGSPKKEATVAFELSQLIKAAMQSTPAAPVTVNQFGKLVKADGSSSAPRQ